MKAGYTNGTKAFFDYNRNREWLDGTRTELSGRVLFRSTYTTTTPAASPATSSCRVPA